MTENKLMVNANTKEYINEYLFIENGEINIGQAIKVLSVSANATILNVESLSKELRVTVCTTFNVIYLTEDGICSMEDKVESNRTISNNNIDVDTKAILSVKVQDTEMTGTNILNLLATVAINGWYENKNCLEILSKDQEDCYVRTEKFNVESVEILDSCSANYNYCNETRVPIDKIIDTNFKVFVNKVFSSEGSCQVEGEINMEIAFVSDNGVLMCQSFSNLFNEEILDENINSDTNLTVEAFVESYNLSLSDEDSRAINSEVCIKMCPSYMEHCEVEGIIDAYSTENEITLSYQEIVLDKEFCLNSARDKITSNVKVEGGLSNVECIVNAYLEGSTITKNEDGLFAEGLLIGDIIYTDEEGEYMSLKVEVPYSTMVAKTFECDDDIVLKDYLSNVLARVRTANEIEVSGETMFEITGKQTQTVKLVSDIEIGEPKEIDDIAITLYIVKEGQTLWDVAKELNTTTEILIDQNPDMEMPLKPNSKILLYKKI